MAKFKIGDRVRVANIDTDDAKSGARVGSTGRVLDNSVAPWVRMDHKIEIHGATTSLCEYGYGKVFAETQLEFESVTIDQTRDQLAKGYEAIENAKACFDKAKEMLDAKDAKPPRNWPERIEAGDCFEDREDNRIWLAISERDFCCVIGENTGVHAYGHREAWVYLGRDILTIRTDAHEPTGAELVGRVVEVTNDPDDMTWGRTYNGKPIVVTDHQPDHACPYKVGEAGNWKFARLAR